jgi:predicted amidophosphoribosyltransferase
VERLEETKELLLRITTQRLSSGLIRRKTMFKMRMICKKCGRKYFRWRESCSTCCSSNVIVVNPKVIPNLEVKEEKKRG